MCSYRALLSWDELLELLMYIKPPGTPLQESYINVQN